MLNMVAQITKSNKTCKLLDMFLVVILPNLMTVQSFLGSTDSTPVTIFGVGLYTYIYCPILGLVRLSEGC